MYAFVLLSASTGRVAPAPRCVCEKSTATSNLRTYTRRSVLAAAAIAATTAFSTHVAAAEPELIKALCGVVRVRDGIYDLEMGTASVDVPRAIRLLVTGSDLKGDADRAVRFLSSDKRDVALDGVREAREMLDLSTQYYDSRNKRATPDQMRVTAEALTRARIALDRALNLFPVDAVHQARDVLSGPVAGL